MTFDEWKKSQGFTTRLMSIEEVEKKQTYPDDGRVPHVPFGFNHEQWIEFKGQMKEGDEIYSYDSSRQAWKDLMGRAGYALVRDGQIIDEIMTRIN